jgi:protein-S-isoprenylcysteine O-methyltransferase Ste14
MTEGSSRSGKKYFSGAPVAVFLLMLFLPLVVYYFWISVHYYQGALYYPSSGEELVALLKLIPAPTGTSIVLYGLWVLFQGLMQIYGPGKIHLGQPQADGTRLTYKMNGFFSFWLTWAVLGAAAAFKWITPSMIYDNFGPLITTANIFAYGLAVFLYAYGKATKQEDRTTGSFFYDFFMGVTLNPRVRGFDLKLFCEARPGLILWIALNFALAAKQYEMHGKVTAPMVMVILFHFWYIADYYFHEDAILTTMDVIHDKFGWMLAWGDLVWVPFTYTLQAYYLLSHTHDLPVWAGIGIVALNTAGFLIFRLSNFQKHRFRHNPDAPVWGKAAEVIETRRGTRLLVSGWWGLARHINYLGDLIMGLAWCLPCLFGSIVPYFYIIYFTILLVHRERRDNRRCGEKYGKDWETYTRRVRWRILPGLY